MRQILASTQTQDLVKRWLSAKDAEKQWQDYRRQVEEQLITLHQPEITSLMEELSHSDKLSATVGLDKLVVKLNRELKIDQVAAIAFMQANPAIAAALFKTELKAANSRAILAALGSSTVPSGLEEAVKVEDKRAWFTAA